MLPLAVGIVAAALSPGGPTARPVELARFPATQTVQTLAIGGANVFAATELPDSSVRLLMLRPGVRRTIGSFSAPRPVEGRAGYELGRITQSLRLAASGSRLAVLRTVRAVWRPECVRRGCGEPGLHEPLLTELYIARPGERLKLLVQVNHRADACALTPIHVVVSGTMISYVARFGEGSACRGGGSMVVVAAFRGNSGVIKRAFAVPRGEVTALALADPYVAWATRRPAPCPCSTVVVASWRTGLTRFRFVAPRLDRIEEIAVTREAAVALVARVQQRQGCKRKEIVVLPAHAVPRLVGARATGMGGLVGETLVHAGFDERGCAGTAPRIVVTDGRGRTRVLRRVGAIPNGLDFDGTHVVYSLPLRSRSSASPQVVYRQRVR
jgi:hypothetical protein